VNPSGSDDITEYSRGLDYLGRYLSYHLDTTIEDPYILLSDRDITQASELVPLMERLSQVDHKRLAVIAPEVEDSALGVLVINREKGDFQCMAVRAPKFGEDRQYMLQDLAIFTGGMVVTGDSGQRIQDMMLSDLGRAERVVATDRRIFIIGGHGDPAQIQARIDDLKRLKDIQEDEDDRIQVEERLALLSGRVAFVRAGGHTLLEQSERKGRIEDALSAFRALQRGGIVPGGGVAYLNAASALGSIQAKGDEGLGIEILCRALETPTRQMAENAGLNGAVVVETTRRLQWERDQQYLGFDIVRERYDDVFAQGIVDPTEVVVTSLINAASCAGTVLTIGAVGLSVAEELPAIPPEIPA
jgi:chaperonin GroEL